MTSPGDDAGGTGWDRPLPDPVRALVVSIAAEAVGKMDPVAVPASLRRVASFAPARRAKAGGTALAAALAGDEPFRHRVAVHLRESRPALTASLDAGAVPAAADPVEVAAVAYVLRGPDWVERVAEAERAVLQRQGDQRVQALQEELAAVREEARRSAERVRIRADEAVAAAEEARAEANGLKRELREWTGTARRAVAEAERLRSCLADVEAERDRQRAAADAEAQRLRARLAEAEAALATERRAVREGRSSADRDVRLLLDTLLGAARGLERELALPPVVRMPADDVAEAAGAAGAAVDVGGGLDPDDPTLVERLLLLPRAHLLVDAYNVTKNAYGDIPLVDQRRRLVTGLAGLAARTGAEVTAVFDGAAVVTTPASWPRGVRVTFSAPGQTADALLLLLVEAEPAGRVLVVASSDREVVAGVRDRGARTVPSATLARLLERG